MIWLALSFALTLTKVGTRSHSESSDSTPDIFSKSQQLSFLQLGVTYTPPTRPWTPLAEGASFFDDRVSAALQAPQIPTAFRDWPSLGPSYTSQFLKEEQGKDQLFSGGRPSAPRPAVPSLPVSPSFGQDSMAMMLNNPVVDLCRTYGFGFVGMLWRVLFSSFAPGLTPPARPEFFNTGVPYDNADDDPYPYEVPGSTPSNLAPPL